MSIFNKKTEFPDLLSPPSEQKGLVVAAKPQEQQEELSPLTKSILRYVNDEETAKRLAFEVDPSAIGYYSPLYRSKLRLIPDKYLKRIPVIDDLVGSIVQARQSHLSAFGRPRQDRHSTGFTFKLTEATIKKIHALPKEQREQAEEEIKERIQRTVDLLVTCGDTSGTDDPLSFSDFLYLTCRNALVVGRVAVEVIYTRGPEGKKFHSFRPIDAGTIYKIRPYQDSAENIRLQALKLLGELKNVRFDPRLYQEDHYKWVQVIDDQVRQAFSADECIVQNFYPVLDVEMDGYPVTPLDSVIAAVTTHINITTHNKLYFQHGRAARGMIVIKSDNANARTVGEIRQQFYASINNVNNSWRMPVFAVGMQDDLRYETIDVSGRDMEFQYLADMNARVILSAFQMSPEELPGYGHLSKGTNNQTLSESNNEYKLEAGRDVGLRPLLKKFEDFINSSIIPLIDPELARLAVFELSGIDAESPEKEAQSLQRDSALHMTYNEIMGKVEKKPLPKEMGGDYPLNPQIQEILAWAVPVGIQKEYFFGEKGASKDPNWNYVRDPFWVQNQQMILQKQAMQQQQPGQAPGVGGVGSTVQNSIVQQSQGQGQEGGDSGEQEDSDLSSAIEQAVNALSKSEKELPPAKRQLLAHQKVIVENAMEIWRKEAGEAIQEVIDLAVKLED